MDSIELFGSFKNYLDGLKDKGEIAGHDPYFLDIHGGDLNGFWMIHGENSKLDEIVNTEEWITWTAKARYTMDGFGVLKAFGNEALAQRMTAFQKVIKK